jgi:glycosyltransferase involved in cell wall biosynthesis
MKATMMRSEGARCAIIVLPGGRRSDLRHCLETVLRYADVPHVLSVRDDGADEHISRLIAQIAKEHAFVEHVRLAEPEPGNGDQSVDDLPEYLVLLHPDTVVTPGWLSRMVRCADSDPRIAAVTSLSSSGDGEMIGMLPGFTLFQMAELVASLSDRQYPEVTVEGAFCLLLRTQALLESGGTGVLEGFARGDEAGLCARLRDSGWRVVCADDTFIYRAAGTFGRRPRASTPLDYLRWRVLAKANPAWFPADAPPPAPAEDREARVKAHREWTPPVGGNSEGPSVAFLLPVVEPFGGVLSVINIANELILSGADITILTMSRYNQFPDHRLYTAPIAVQERSEIAELFPQVEVAVATQWETVEHILRVRELHPEVETFYFAQDYEVNFLPEDDAEGRQRVRETYRQLRRKVVKTEYLRERISEIDPVVFKIIPGMDLDTFYPRRVATNAERSRRVLCMARPNTPWRGFDVMCGVFAKVHEAWPQAEFLLYGTDDLGPYAQDLQFPYTNYGRLAPRDLPELYSACAIYADFSHAHGFGRTGAEAMACGAACVLTESGGVSEYAINEWNALLCETGDVEALVQVILRLLRNPELRAYLSRNGVATVGKYQDRTAAKQLYDLFRRACAEEI